MPAAGKTGTSHDGWFAGFTSELLCIVWVGFDDNRELDLEGAKSALPIWTEFMKRALDYKEYRNTKPFDAPDGIVTLEIDPLSGQPATANCPTRRQEVFIAGTQPLDSCHLARRWPARPHPRHRMGSAAFHGPGQRGDAIGFVSETAHRCWRRSARHRRAAGQARREEEGIFRPHLRCV